MVVSDDAILDGHSHGSSILALDTPRHTPEFARHHPALHVLDMSPTRASSLSTLPVRGAVGFAGLAAFAWAAAIYALGRVPLDPGFFPALILLVAAGMITRRYGIPLPGNGFASYVLGVMILAVLLRGSAFGVLVAPGAMLGGDLLLRRLPWRAAVSNAAHLSVGTALVGLGYEVVGGATGAEALGAANVWPL